MFAFIKHSLDGSQVRERIELSHPDLLEPAGAGFAWTEIPTPAAEWTVQPDGHGGVAIAPFVRSTAAQAALLKLLESQLHAAIDEAAGEFRQRFITTVPGQEMTYLEKERQGRAWLAASSPSANDPAYFMLRAEADALGVTVAARVPVIIAQADAWRQLGSLIEGRRMGAKAAVTAASTRTAKEDAANVDWGALLT